MGVGQVVNGIGSRLKGESAGMSHLHKHKNKNVVVQLTEPYVEQNIGLKISLL